MNAPFAWPGGKRLLKNRLLKLIPQHHLYVEVFAGSAKLLFAKEPSQCEVINDLNGDLTNFFRIAKHRPAELAELFDLEIVHAGRFKELKGMQEQDELHRALRFAYLVWYSYSAKGEHFAGANAKVFGKGNSGQRRSLDRVRDLLQRTSSRLRTVLIEQRDFLQVIERYDSDETFFYLDPPYVHFQNNGRYQSLSDGQRDLLFQKLAALRGKFLLSFDDCSEIRTLAKLHRMHVRRVETNYTIGSTRSSRMKKIGEVIISKDRFAV